MNQDKTKSKKDPKFSKIRSSICIGCGSNKIKVGDFRDLASVKEFETSGMCQTCQDNAFGRDWI